MSTPSHASTPTAEPPAPESYSYSMIDVTLAKAIYDGTASPAEREAFILDVRRTLDEVSRLVRHGPDDDDVLLAARAETERRELAEMLAPEFSLVPRRELFAVGHVVPEGR